ncbi:MAG: hypothetical protein O7D35_01870 [Acidobacteria bacterium]|nr:hypothetical protein [Acidobacteriota bacterium]
MMPTCRPTTTCGVLLAAACVLLTGCQMPTTDAETTTFAAKAARERAAEELLAQHGSAHEERIHRGVDQLARMWRESDGNTEAFVQFARDEFLPAGDLLDDTFNRFEYVSESLDGYFNAMIRDLRRGVDLEIGPLLPLDRRLAAFNSAAHLSDDLFNGKIAQTALLNFPLTDLQEKLTQGGNWTRRQWAEARLTDRFDTRVPASVGQAMTAAAASADTYISNYNIYMHHLLTPDGRRLFPEGLRLISHWGLRDELKAQYADPDGLPRQRMIHTVMERIVRQEIPAAVINNPLLDWQPAGNIVSPPADAATTADEAREDDERYRQWLGIFHAAQLADTHQPDQPSLIARRFNVDREIPEEEVEALLEAVLASPLAGRVARLVASRLGRPLEPFDIWYVGFKARGQFAEADLDARTRARYPDAAAYAADIPRLLQDLGFSREQATFLAGHIVVEPSRGAGHAMGAARRDDNAHLRTRVGTGGMDYKGYNIAVHEMGHNVEQVFSMTLIDHTLLQGVPNTAFTEALAFVFQERDMELLGLDTGDAGNLKPLEAFWATREIAGVALVDMRAWRWLYAHPDASPATFRKAVVEIAAEVWNAYHADIFGVRDVPLLAIYSHMVDGAMYTPDYPLGHLIAFQIEEHFNAHRDRFGTEFERICRLGRLTPNAWMEQAVGAPLSAEPLLKAAAAALSRQEKAGAD